MQAELSVAAAPNAVEKHRRYVALVERVRAVAARALPPGASVLVVSKGDDELLRLDPAYGGHFPQAADGRYGGYYPKTSDDAIAHLEALRARGAEFLLIPATATWWLDHYAALRDHLEARYACIVAEPDTCVVYRLAEPRAPSRAAAAEATTPREQLDDLVRALLPPGARVAVASASPGDRYTAWSPPSDASDPDLGAAVAASLADVAFRADFIVVPADVGPRVRRVVLAVLERRYRLITDQPRVCSIFRLAPTPVHARPRGPQHGRFADAARVLFPPGAAVAVEWPADAEAVRAVGARPLEPAAAGTNGSVEGAAVDAEFVVARVSDLPRAPRSDDGVLIWSDDVHAVFARIESGGEVT